MLEYHDIIFGMCFFIMWGWVFSNTSFWTLSCLWFNSMQSLSGEFRTVWTTESCIQWLERLSVSPLAPVDSDLILSKLPFLGLCDSPTMSLLPGQRPSFPATFYTSPSSFFLPPCDLLYHSLGFSHSAHPSSSPGSWKEIHLPFSRKE